MQKTIPKSDESFTNESDICVNYGDEIEVVSGFEEILCLVGKNQACRTALP